MTEKYSLTPDSFQALKFEKEHEEGLQLREQSAGLLGDYSNSLSGAQREEQVGFFAKIKEAIKGRIK